MFMELRSSASLRCSLISAPLPTVGKMLPGVPLPRRLEVAIAEDATKTGDVVDEVVAWLEANWDPDLTVGEWGERLGLSGWAAPSLPEAAYGKGLSPNAPVRGQGALSRFGALGAPPGSAPAPAAPATAP